MARELAIENGKLKSDLDANGNKVVNLATPTSDNDAATKKYVDEHGVTLDDTVTETSANGVKSSGIWSFVKGLLPSWLTPSREEPPTQASVAAKYTKPSDGIPLSDLKPTTFPPEAHAASHKTGGTDALTPSDIGAVAAVPGKQLSTNDYTTAEKTKLAGIEAGAEVNPTPVAPSTEIDEGATADAKKVAEFVNSSINAMAAFYITKNAAGDAFATKAELTAAIAAGTFYNGGALRTPTKNDYLYVLADESATPIIPGVAPTTRYSYDGAQWAFQIVVNNTALTSAQVAAINSGMTAALVSWLSTFKGGDTSTTLASVLSAIAGKLDKSGDTMTGNLEVTNSDGYPKVLVGDSGGDYAEYQKDGIFTANGWIGFGAKNGTVAVEDDFSPSAPAAYVGAFVQKAVRYQEITPANTALSEAAINILTTAGQTYTLPTLAAGEKRVRDLLLYVNTTAAAFAINFPSGTQLLGDNPSITEAGEYIITMTAMPSGKWFVRKIKMEAAQ